VTVHFSKHFVGGTLAGLVYRDTLSFPTLAQAQEWARNNEGRRVRGLCGSSAYVIHACVVK
jgi:hypothetical protein